MDKRRPVQVSIVLTADLPDGLDHLDDVTVGDRAVLLIDALPVEPAIHMLRTALTKRGFEILHAVYLDDAIDIQAVGGLAVLRVGTSGDAGLTRANLDAVTVDGQPNWERARAAFGKMAAQYESTLEALHDVQAELRSAEAHRRTAEARLENTLSSTTMRVGQAAVAVGRHPVRGARRAAGILRDAWRSHRAPAPRRTTRPAVRTAADGPPRMNFYVPMPVPPGPDRGQPRELHITVPNTYLVARHLLKNGIGGYEPSTIAWYLALCDTAPAGAVWDVGANLGPYALLARAYSDRDIVAFEPTPDLAHWARHLSEINDLPYRLEQIAAGETAGTATFYLSESSDSSNSLAEGFRVSKRQLDVLVEPLDRYARRTGSVPAVMKVDTETTEHHVLRGARDVLAEHRPWIVCEVLSGRAPEQPLTELLGDLGYHFFHLNGSDPLPEKDVIKGDPTYEHMNYLFAPGPIDDELAAAARGWQAALEATPRPRQPRRR
ncbi:FkbM family methyltransferase [Jiangella alkaliphila]|uniref:FkbM family methyltransferase n=1 Tax=Jiangella alkaliphila TaxID=419479 RepID=UPI001364AA88|nr:FkbM family methyltransferase [Jiangella alkaliphila]